MRCALLDRRSNIRWCRGQNQQNPTRNKTRIVVVRRCIFRVSRLGCLSSRKVSLTATIEPSTHRRVRYPTQQSHRTSQLFVCGVKSSPM